MRAQIIGAGLAGSEAAWQCARRGVAVELYEMRPVRATPAHQTAGFAELVCSNSLKSESENTAPWLLKEELRRAGSLLLEIARETAVPAGHALAVDRAEFSRKATEAISRKPLITIRREEVTQIEAGESTIVVIATGPLTSDNLSREIARLCATSSGASRLYFYDSISPIVEAGSIDMSKVYLAARYDKGSADYINCPMSKDEYDKFYDALLAAQSVEQKDWENLNYFESCLPIEEIARRGRDTLRFGPMKPVGSKTLAPAESLMPSCNCGRKICAPIPTTCRIPESPEIWRAGARAEPDPRPRKRALPALRTDSPQHLYQRARTAQPDAAIEALPNVMFAGQICGVEGYVESIATGLMAGLNAAALATGGEPRLRRDQRLWAPLSTTSRRPRARTFSRPISPSTCCPPSTERSATAKSAIGCNVNLPCKNSRTGSRTPNRRWSDGRPRPSLQKPRS